MSTKFSIRLLALGGMAAGVLGLATGSASAQVIPPEIQASINATTTAVISAVTRPTSPFVTGIAAEIQPNTCGAAPWVRGSGGLVSSTTAGATVDVRYGSALVAADVGCFNMNGSGFDLTAGAELGKLWATGNQPATPSAYATLDQTFLAGYITAAKGGFAGDVEVRREWNTFTAQGLGGVGIPDGTQLNVDRTIVNAGASYAIPFANNFSFIPAAGLSYLHTDAASVTLPAGTASIAADDGLIGYIGATLATTIVLPDQASALQPFATATYYHDFGTDLTGTFTPAGGGAPITAQLSGLGDYGELSLGINYVKVLDGPGAPRQFSATLRGDAKFNGTFHGFNVTAQARLQF